MSVVFWIVVAAVILAGCSGGRKKNTDRKNQVGHLYCRGRISVQMTEEEDEMR